MSKETGKKIFVGGYYDNDRIFEGYFNENITLFKNVDCYTLEEALKLPFIEGVKEWFEETDIEERAFNEISDEEKIKAILTYISGDEIAELVYCETEEEARKIKQVDLDEIEEINKLISEGKMVYAGTKQDEYGNFKEVYKRV